MCPAWASQQHRLQSPTFGACAVVFTTSMSTERGVGKPWTPEEDRLLTQAVATHGEVDNWKTVALSVPGRTNKACRKVCTYIIFSWERDQVCASALASLAFAQCQEDGMDDGRGPETTLVIHDSRIKVGSDRPQYIWTHGRCMLEAVPRGVGPSSEARRVDVRRRWQTSRRIRQARWQVGTHRPRVEQEWAGVP